MKNAALTTMGIGAMGFMIAASGIDGPTSGTCAILAVASIGIVMIGNKIYKLAKEGERLERERPCSNERRRQP